SQNGREVALLVALALVPILGFRLGNIADTSIDQLSRRVASVEDVNSARHLTTTQVNTLRAWIDGFPGHHADVAADSKANDSHVLAAEILAQFIAAKWKMRGRDPAVPAVIDVLESGNSTGEILIGVSDP